MAVSEGEVVEVGPEEAGGAGGWEVFEEVFGDGEKELGGEG